LGWGVPEAMPLLPPGKDEGWEADTPLIYACKSPTVPLPARGFRDPGAGVGSSVPLRGRSLPGKRGMGVSGLVLQTPSRGAGWGV